MHVIMSEMHTSQRHQARPTSARKFTGEEVIYPDRLLGSTRDVTATTVLLSPGMPAVCGVVRLKFTRMLKLGV